MMCRTCLVVVRAAHVESETCAIAEIAGALVVFRADATRVIVGSLFCVRTARVMSCVPLASDKCVGIAVATLPVIAGT